jgi:hypothetical protein
MNITRNENQLQNHNVAIRNDVLKNVLNIKPSGAILIYIGIRIMTKGLVPLEHRDSRLNLVPCMGA